jgi:hypothetical protein
VLRAGGALALVWNMRDTTQPLQRGLEAMLAPFRRDAGAESGAWREPFARSQLFGGLEEARFRHEQRLTVAGLCDRVASTSFVATLPERERQALLGRVRALASGLDEPFPFPYVTEVYLARATAPAASSRAS